jgi:hypothetical protein
MEFFGPTPNSRHQEIVKKSYFPMIPIVSFEPESLDSPLVHVDEGKRIF